VFAVVGEGLAELEDGVGCGHGWRNGLAMFYLKQGGTASPISADFRPPSNVRGGSVPGWAGRGQPKGARRRDNRRPERSETDDRRLPVGRDRRGASTLGAGLDCPQGCPKGRRPDVAGLSQHGRVNFKFPDRVGMTTAIGWRGGS
jgi:hypothetical protein